MPHVSSFPPQVWQKPVALSITSKTILMMRKNTILMVGYCTPESLGGRLRNGNKTVRIFGEEHEVKAHVEVMDYYSGHADYEEILTFLSCQQPEKIKQIFLVHGEEETQQYFRLKLLDKGYKNIMIPSREDIFDI
jgi:metallo-beta-lactamase family protein